MVESHSDNLYDTENVMNETVVFDYVEQIFSSHKTHPCTACISMRCRYFN